MGARFCLHVALTNPELVAGLVLIGGTAGIEDPDERDARRAQDLRTAERIAEEGLAPFLDAWLPQPLFAGLPADEPFREERLTHTVAGLPSSPDQAGTGAQATSGHKLARPEMPLPSVAAAHDSKVPPAPRH